VPYGNCWAIWNNEAPELLLSGPAGTGKSRAILEKLHYLCDHKFPGMRALIVRKTRESLTESGLVTYEDKVLPAGHAVLHAGGQRRMRQAYHYPNGSTVVVGGMDKPSKTLSTEFDFIYVQEAIELAEHDWEMLTRPLRNGVMPYQQIIADTNPDAPTHWLKRRCDAGKTLLLESRHEDNPVLWDRGKSEWTEAGRAYIAKLDALTGARKPRLRYGRWVQAEGVVYEGWNVSVHLIDRFPIPRHWRRFWSIDFGFTNPFVWQQWAMDGDGRLFLIREIYKSKRLIEDHARRILEVVRRDIPPDELRQLGDQLGPYHPQAILCDPEDAEGRATLEKYLGMRTQAAQKSVLDGIQAVAGRLADAGDGKPRLFILRDSLDERDPELDESKVPCCTAEEFDSYIWKTPATTALADRTNKPDEPLDKHNHGMDAMRYLCYHFERPTLRLPDAGAINDPYKRREIDNYRSRSVERGMYGRGRERDLDEE
jgi:phage terminase large subunit